MMLSKVDDEEIKLDYILDSSGQKRKAIFLTEDRLYSLVEDKLSERIVLSGQNR